MTHRMQLMPSPFRMIKNGEKTIELRLYDEKRRAIRVGDRIVFTDTGSGETLTVKVSGLFVFDSFDTLYQKLPLTACGYTEDELETASPRDMDAFYSEVQQRQYGVLGIEIALTDEEGL